MSVSAKAEIDTANTTIVANKNVETLFNIHSPPLYNAWKFTKVVVDNGSALVAKEYGNIAGQTINVPAASIGSVLIGTVDIPTDKTQARVKFSGLKGYNLGSGSWLSAVIVGKLGEIN